MEVEPEDGESHERAEFYTHEKDVQNLKRAFKEEGGKVGGKKLCLTLEEKEKYVMDQKH